MVSDLRITERGSDFVPILRGDILVRRIDNEAIAWSDIALRPVHLDPVAAVMLDVIDGVATTAELIEDVHVALDIDESAARNQVMRVIDLYKESGLLASSEPAPMTWSESCSLLPEPDF